MIFFDQNQPDFEIEKRIEKHAYNTYSAKFHGRFWRGSGSDFHDFKAGLFQHEKSDQFFVAGFGNCLSPFGHTNKRDEQIPGENVILLSNEKGQRWISGIYLIEEFEAWAHARREHHETQHKRLKTLRHAAERQGFGYLPDNELLEFAGRV